jgi:U3 small nucleolar ribonucleoprotein protein IMP3
MMYERSRSFDVIIFKSEKIITSMYLDTFHHCNPNLHDHSIQNQAVIDLIACNAKSIIHSLPFLRYNKIAGNIKQLANRISLLDSRDPFRAQKEKALLDKLYAMGIITSTAKFSDCNKVTVSAFCRRRLPIVMCRLKMSETVKEAVTFVEQGHVRVGPETITDPAFLVTRNMEDFVTWVDTSKIKRKILKYNDKVRVLVRVRGFGAPRC